MSVVAPSRLLRGVPARALLAWCGFGLSPVLLFFWLSTGASADWPFGLRLIVPIVAMLLPAGVLLRRPFLALAVWPIQFEAMAPVRRFGVAQGSVASAGPSSCHQAVLPQSFPTGPINDLDL